MQRNGDWRGRERYGTVGASVMGTVFALGSATTNIMTARPEAVATGMRITFAVAATLIVVALAIAMGKQNCCHTPPASPGSEGGLAVNLTIC